MIEKRRATTVKVSATATLANSTAIVLVHPKDHPFRMIGHDRRSSSCRDQRPPCARDEGQNALADVGDAARKRRYIGFGGIRQRTRAGLSAMRSRI